MSQGTERSKSHAAKPHKMLFAGVHLSGSNANKTSLVVLEGPSLAAGAHGPEAEGGESPAPLKIGKVYEKIGSFGSLFSDERLVEILAHGGPFAEVFIDCPLTAPPCVACTRPVCPGAVKCEDVSVAYMLKVSGRLRRRGARKARPINPQSQRLWDVLQLDRLEAQGAERLEPSYSANLAPMVARSRTLQRRLNGLLPKIELKETNVGSALEMMRRPLALPDAVRVLYRNFEGGLACRREVVESMIERRWLDVGDGLVGEDVLDTLSRSVETFHAFVSAWVAALHHLGMTTERPEAYVEGEGWVHLPELELLDGAEEGA